jgi:hypothetical protein
VCRTEQSITHQVQNQRMHGTDQLECFAISSSLASSLVKLFCVARAYGSFSDVWQSSWLGELGGSRQVARAYGSFSDVWQSSWLGELGGSRQVARAYVR